MRTFLSFILILFTSYLFAQDEVLTLSRTDGRSVQVSVNDIKYIYDYTSTSKIIFARGGGSIDVTNTIATIQTSYPNLFCQVTSEAAGRSLLVSRVLVSSVAEEGSGARIILKEGFGILDVDETVATVNTCLNSSSSGPGGIYGGSDTVASGAYAEVNESEAFVLGKTDSPGSVTGDTAAGFYLSNNTFGSTGLGFNRPDGNGVGIQASTVNGVWAGSYMYHGADAGDTVSLSNGFARLDLRSSGSNGFFNTPSQWMASAGHLADAPHFAADGVDPKKTQGRFWIYNSDDRRVDPNKWASNVGMGVSTNFFDGYLSTTNANEFVLTMGKGGTTSQTWNYNKFSNTQPNVDTFDVLRIRQYDTASSHVDWFGVDAIDDELTGNKVWMYDRKLVFPNEQPSIVNLDTTQLVWIGNGTTAVPDIIPLTGGGGGGNGMFSSSNQAGTWAVDTVSLSGFTSIDGGSSYSLGGENLTAVKFTGGFGTGTFRAETSFNNWNINSINTSTGFSQGLVLDQSNNELSLSSTTANTLLEMDAIGITLNSNGNQAVFLEGGGIDFSNGRIRTFGQGALDAVGANQITFSNTSGAQFAKIHLADDGALDIYTDGSDPSITIRTNGQVEYREAVESEVTTNSTAVLGSTLPVDPSGGNITITIPASPVAGDWFEVFDSANAASSGTNEITLDFITAGDNVSSASQNVVINGASDGVRCKYVDAAIGWLCK